MTLKEIKTITNDCWLNVEIFDKDRDDYISLNRTDVYVAKIYDNYEVDFITAYSENEITVVLKGEI